MKSSHSCMLVQVYAIARFRGSRSSRSGASASNSHGPCGRSSRKNFCASSNLGRSIGMISACLFGVTITEDPVALDPVALAEIVVAGLGWLGAKAARLDAHCAQRCGDV